MPPSIPAFDIDESRLISAPSARPGAFGDALRTREGALGFVLTLLSLGIGLLAPLLAPADPLTITGPSLSAPSFDHPMGTDTIGRDLLSGVLFGARTSLTVAALAGALAFALGLTVGTVSGYKGGFVDEGLMRITEFFQVLPRFFFAVIAVAILGPGLDRLVLILGLTSWPVLARVVRAEVLSLKHHDFVRAAEATGASAARVVFHELVPNVLPSALVLVGLLAGQMILIEASLGFVGLTDASVISWGGLAGQARGLVQVAWWLPVFPGLAIAASVLGLNLFCDALSARIGGR